MIYYYYYTYRNIRKLKYIFTRYVVNLTREKLNLALSRIIPIYYYHNLIQAWNTLIIKLGGYTEIFLRWWILKTNKFRKYEYLPKKTIR